VINQKVAVGMLRQRGHHVELVDDGEQAVVVSGQGEFDVILMDVQMPKMDGIEATRRIRRRELQSGGHVKIIAMTAHAMVEDRQECLDAGADRYLTKPFAPKDVINTINTILTDKSLIQRREKLSGLSG